MYENSIMPKLNKEPVDLMAALEKSIALAVSHRKHKPRESTVSEPLKRYTFTVEEVLELIQDCDVLHALDCTVDVQASGEFQITIEPSGYTAPELLIQWGDAQYQSDQVWVD